ncbi:MAG: toxin-antitoxin system HicB family antitoxin [Chloroflexi bacterium]|nr:toxin-antitoxin system HicB family antitoxin [Chloroflexota bacterium]
MPKTIQVRNVPDEVHREAKARAAREGISLSAYVLRILERSLGAPPIDEVLARLRSREPVELPQSSAAMIREIHGPL